MRRGHRRGDAAADRAGPGLWQREGAGPGRLPLEERLRLPADGSPAGEEPQAAGDGGRRHLRPPGEAPPRGPAPGPLGGTGLRRHGGAAPPAGPGEISEDRRSRDVPALPFFQPLPRSPDFEGCPEAAFPVS